jgi:LPXTG-site transpeptidase (sortase) family protein
MFKTPATSVFTQNLKPIVYAPRFFSVEKIGLNDVPVIEVGVDAVGRLEVPKSFDEAGWYKDGAKPGEAGNTIIAGHYDRSTGAPAVFFNLVKLEVGDKIVVRDASDRKFTYLVKTVEYVDVNDPASIEKAYEHSDTPIMTVITCGGVWNSYSHDYSKRLLIKAELAK